MVRVATSKSQRRLPFFCGPMARLRRLAAWLFLGLVPPLWAEAKPPPLMSNPCLKNTSRFAALPFWLISIAKKSLRMVPVFGWAVAAGGTVRIDRKNHAADMKSMKVAEESLRKRPRS